MHSNKLKNGIVNPPFLPDGMKSFLKFMILFAFAPSLNRLEPKKKQNKSLVTHTLLC